MARHPKTIRLAARLNTNKAQVVGHLHILWWWVMDFAPDGDLSEFSNAEIAAAAEWSDDPETFVVALQQTGWLDGMHVHDWGEYTERLMAKRESNRERQKRFRDRHSEPKQPVTRYVTQDQETVTRDESVSNAPTSEPVTVSNGATVPNRTVPYQRESESNVTTHNAPPAPSSEPSPSPEIPGGDPVRDVLRQDKEFCASWMLWKQHLADLGKPMVSRGQETAVLLECGRNGVRRSCDVIAYSIAKGAKNLIWDAPKTKRKPSDPPAEDDPPEWKRWLEEAYPTREYIAFSNAPDTVQSEFRRHTRHSR